MDASLEALIKMTAVDKNIDPYFRASLVLSMQNEKIHKGEYGPDIKRAVVIISGDKNGQKRL